MCGIVGLQLAHSDAQGLAVALSRALPLLASRGPDHQAQFIHNRTALGHTRLSIQDLHARAHQPMADSTKRYRIVYNGEVYNAPALRKELASKGYPFRTHSDTEVVLAAYLTYGENALERLNGFFAFAIYDSFEESLILARDRFGIKPLYYAPKGTACSGFAFASELKALIPLLARAQICKQALHTYFQLYFIPHPNTLLEGVYKLPPAHYLRISKEKITCVPFYRTPYTPNPPCAEDYAQQQKQLVAKLERSVQRRLLADVPVGCFLSGGVDSSIVASIAARLHPKIETFSIGYADAPAFDESGYARTAAKHFGVQHHSFSLTTEELADSIDQVAQYWDEPLADSSALPTYLLAKRTANHVKVALSGDGADELFSGYSRHKAHYAALYRPYLNALLRLGAPLLHKLPVPHGTQRARKWTQYLRYLMGIQKPLKARYWLWSTHRSQQETNQLIRPEWHLHSQQNTNLDTWTTYLNGTDPLNGILYADLHLLLPGDMLTKVDRMSMAHGLEVRVPYLDHEVVEYAFSIPATSKWTSTKRKRILRDAFKQQLPPLIYRRKKQGFEVPLTQLLSTTHHSVLQRYIFDRDQIQAQGLFQWRAIKELQTAFTHNPQRTHATTLWALYLFQKWCKQYHIQCQPTNEPTPEHNLVPN